LGTEDFSGGVRRTCGRAVRKSGILSRNKADDKVFKKGKKKKVTWHLDALRDLTCRVPSTQQLQAPPALPLHNSPSLEEFEIAAEGLIQHLLEPAAAATAGSDSNSIRSSTSESSASLADFQNAADELISEVDAAAAAAAVADDPVEAGDGEQLPERGEASKRPHSSSPTTASDVTRRRTDLAARAFVVAREAAEKLAAATAAAAARRRLKKRRTPEHVAEDEAIKVMKRRAKMLREAAVEAARAAVEAARDAAVDDGDSGSIADDYLESPLSALPESADPMPQSSILADDDLEMPLSSLPDSSDPMPESSVYGFPPSLPPSPRTPQSLSPRPSVYLGSPGTPPPRSPLLPRTPATVGRPARAGRRRGADEEDTPPGYRKRYIPLSARESSGPAYQLEKLPEAPVKRQPAQKRKATGDGPRKKQFESSEARDRKSQQLPGTKRNAAAAGIDSSPIRAPGGLRPKKSRFKKRITSYTLW